MINTKDIVIDEMRDEIIQLKARIEELELTIDELARSSFNVVKYFAEKKS